MAPDWRTNYANWHSIAIYRLKCPCYNGHAQNCICTHIHSTFQASAPAGVIFFAEHTPCAFLYGSPLETGALETGSPSGIVGFSTITNFTGGNSLKKETNNSTGNQLPKKKKFRIPYQNIIVGGGSLCLLFCPSDRSGPCNGYVDQGRKHYERCVWQDTGDFHHCSHCYRFRRPAPYELFQIRQDGG